MKQRLLLLAGCTLLAHFGFAQNGIYIGSGAQVVCVGNPVITLNDIKQFQNKGTFVPGQSTVNFNGTTIATAVGLASGGSPINFYDINVNNSKNVTLAQSIGVNHNITLSKGKLMLKGKGVALGSTGAVIGESEKTRITDDTDKLGTITISQIVPASTTINPGNLGMEFITSATSLGTTEVRRICGSAVVNGSKAGIIQRYFRVTPTTNTNLNVGFRFRYLKAELNGASATSMLLWKSGNGTTWTSFAPDIRDTVGKFLRKNANTTLAKYYTIGDALGHKMPMFVEAFNLKQKDEGNDLTWIADDEEDPYDHFILEKSTDQSNWSYLSDINANDNTNEYAYSDMYLGTAYYRLKQMRKDGSFTYSKVLKADRPVRGVNIMIYPNPARNYFNVTFVSPVDGETQMNLIAASGEIVKTLPVAINKGNNNVMVNVRGLAAGTYTLMIKDKEINFSKQVIIQ